MSPVLRNAEVVGARKGFPGARIGASLLIWGIILLAIIIVLGIATNLVTADWSDAAEGGARVAVVSPWVTSLLGVGGVALMVLAARMFQRTVVQPVRAEIRARRRRG